MDKVELLSLYKVDFFIHLNNIWTNIISKNELILSTMDTLKFFYFEQIKLWNTLGSFTNL